MSDRVIVVGLGFAGLWSALAAARAADRAGRVLEIVVVAPEPALHIRPRFYESDLSVVAPSVRELLDVAKTVSTPSTQSSGVTWRRPIASCRPGICRVSGLARRPAVQITVEAPLLPRRTPRPSSLPEAEAKPRATAMHNERS